MNITNEIERLIQNYGNDVLRIANMYVKDAALAEDIFQDVFVKVYEKYNSFKGNSSEKTWLIRITINACKDYLKSAYNKKVVGMDEYIVVDNEFIEEDVINQEERKGIVEKILSLPDKYKEVLILYYYEEFNTAEIAGVLKLPEATIRTRMKRARDMLKEKIELKMVE